MASNTVINYAPGDKIDLSLALIKFGAPWCGPCRRCSPAYKELSSKYPDVTFYDVNVDDFAEMTLMSDEPHQQAFNDKISKITALPNFVLYKDVKIIAEIKSWKPEELSIELNNLCNSEQEVSDSSGGDLSEGSEAEIPEPSGDEVSEAEICSTEEETSGEENTPLIDE